MSIVAPQIWRSYLGLADRLSLKYGVAREFILAVIDTESKFNPWAIRGEPQKADASRGLMQLLLTTARGLGFTGAPDDLFDPEINADLGVRLLAQGLRRSGGKMEEAASEYNGGYRPSLGFGKRATVPVTVCVAYDPIIPGRCIKYHTALPGQFGNQAHVDRVMDAWRAFVAALSTASPPSSGGGPPVSGGGSSGGSVPGDTGAGPTVGFGVVLLVALGAWLAFR